MHLNDKNVLISPHEYKQCKTKWENIFIYERPVGWTGLTVAPNRNQKNTGPSLKKTEIIFFNCSPKLEKIGFWLFTQSLKHLTDLQYSQSQNDHIQINLAKNPYHLKWNISSSYQSSTQAETSQKLLCYRKDISMYINKICEF